MNNKIHMVVEIEIADGKSDAMKEVSGQAVQIVKDKEPDTLLFNQYISDDSRSVFSVESYANSEAAIQHLKNATKNIHIVEGISSIKSLRVFGDVSDELRAMLKAYGSKIYRPYTGVEK